MKQLGRAIQDVRQEPTSGGLSSRALGLIQKPEANRKLVALELDQTLSSCLISKEFEHDDFCEQAMKFCAGYSDYIIQYAFDRMRHNYQYPLVPADLAKWLRRGADEMARRARINRKPEKPKKEKWELQTPEERAKVLEGFNALKYALTKPKAKPEEQTISALEISEKERARRVKELHGHRMTNNNQKVSV